MQRAVISGTGAYIPHETKKNYDFVMHNFYSDDNNLIKVPSHEIVEKFKLITGIEERRYAPHELNTSDIGAMAAKGAIEDAGVDPETLDQIIVAHNFGNVIKHSIQTDLVPSLANRIKHTLGIRNPNCIGYDIVFGCPGWLQGVIHADAFFKAGLAKKALVIGTEILSRVIDLYDRDCMIFSDGAGATVLEAQDGDAGSSGIMSTSAQSYSVDEAYYINMGKSYLPDADPGIRYLKMKGRKVYEFAIKVVPQAMKECIEKSGVSIDEVKKIFIHQANEKMDEVIIKNMYKLFGFAQPPENIMPMNIRELGNSSVATIPTLLNMVRKGQLPDHEVQKGDIVLFASVGAGMNVNAACYRM